jgi:signal transduction histidine kinase
MFLRSLNRLRKTLGFRLTMWYSGLFTTSVMVLFGVAYWLLSSSMERRDREAISLKLTEYIAEYQRGGVEAIERKIAFEENQVGKILFFVRMAKADNTTLFFTIPQEWENFDLQQLERRGTSDARKWIALPARDDEEVLEIASTRLPDGALLQVGATTDEREDLLERFRNTFAGIMIPVVVVGLTGGAFLALRALRPLRGLIATLRSILTTGTLTARAPVADTGDELDELSLLFNGMLDKIEMLIAGMQNSLDTVAHDLRTPMTRLRGMAELALRSKAHEQVLRDALANCIEESDRILAMVNTLMDISEAETGAMKLTVEQVHVRELVEQAVDLYRYVAEDKAVTITTRVPENLSLKADRSRMLQVLANLLDNAVKYTPCEGRVEIAAVLRQDHVVITVADTGSGIAPHELPKIWDRLYRGDTSRSQRGLGLGLSLVKAIVQAHQGSVEASNNSGSGACFTLCLPTHTPT